MVSDDDGVAPEVSQELGGAAGRPVNFGVSVELAGRDLGFVHLVHRPDVVEEVSCPEPGVRLGNVVGGAQHVPFARVAARSETRNATEQSLDGGHLPEKNSRYLRHDPLRPAHKRFLIFFSIFVTFG